MFFTKKHKIFQRLLQFLTIVMLCLITTLTSASAQELFQSISPNLTYIETDNDYDTRALNSTLYVSEDEIWYSGVSYTSGSWFVRTNRTGEIVFERTFADAPGENPVIHCIAKVDDAMMFGFIDGDKQDGSIGVMGNVEDKVTYYTIDSNINVTSMTAAPNGILLLGVQYNLDKNVSSLYTSLITPSGKTAFEIKELVTVDMNTDAYTLASSRGIASAKGYFVQLNVGREPQRVQPGRYLIGFDLEGNEQWRIVLPDEFSVQGLSASDDAIYLYGMTGDLDVNDTLVNHKAMVYCYKSSDGSERWHQSFETVDKFYYSNADNNGCAACTGLNDGAGSWIICSWTADGTLENYQQTAFTEPVTIRGIFLTEDKNVMVLGSLGSSEAYDKRLVFFTVAR